MVRGRKIVRPSTEKYRKYDRGAIWRAASVLCLHEVSILIFDEDER